ncbi:FAD:protein FMN transferase [Leifsonia sp. LS1]|nr:FAD:protein FMN transferase [Leifsonia sp. LS1]
MGIPMSVDVRDDLDAAPAVEAAFRALREADRRFSTYRSDSEVSLLNATRSDAAAGSADLREVVALGLAMSEASGGAFRVRGPDGRWDLDGVVKGWAADRAARTLTASGIGHFCLNAGGDVAVSGSPGEGRPWNVAVRSPESPAGVLAVLSVTDSGVATSGAYERGAHIVDGRSGRPASGLRSATVVADDLTTADLLATAVFALGEEGLPWALAHGARGVLAVAADGRLLGQGALDFAPPGSGR